MELKNLAKQIHDLAIEKGWWEGCRSFGEIVALCHSELSEALEEDRNGHSMVWFKKDGKIETDLNKWAGEKLEGIAVEMADCIIRILDWCAKENIDIDKIIEYKHRYNISRPYKHGGKKY